MSTPEQRLEARKRAWWRWHKMNPKVWEQFERFALEVARTGRKRYSAWAVIQRVRWHTTIETTGSDFKISNDYIAFYARFFNARHPEHAGLFVTKAFKEEKQSAIITTQLTKRARRRALGFRELQADALEN